MWELQNAAADGSHDGHFPDTGDVAQIVDLLQAGIGELDLSNQFGVGAGHGLVLQLVLDSAEDTIYIQLVISGIAHDEQIALALFLEDSEQYVDDI